MLFTRLLRRGKVPFPPGQFAITAAPVYFRPPSLPENAMTAPLVIFDLDGTLIDTAPDLIASLNHTIAAADLAPVTFDDLTHLISQGARVMIRRAFALRGHEINELEVEPLLHRFLDHYKREMPGS